MHHSLELNDTFQIPPGSVAKIYERLQFMGWYNATYIYAQQQARLRLGGAMQTFVWIETLVEKENLVAFTPSQIARDLSISPATVYAHIAKCRAEHVLIPDAREESNANIRLWRICPFHAWRGRAKGLVSYLDKLPSDHSFFEYMDPEFKEAIEKLIGEEAKP